MTDKYITVWRKAPPNSLDWDFHVSFAIEDARSVVANIKKQGVRHFRTYKIGDQLPDLSSQH